jgi:hypothetical protein
MTALHSPAARRIGAWASQADGDGGVQRRRDRACTAGVAGLTLLVYSRTLLPGVGYSGDVAKWQYMSVTGGVPHATGEPLWVALIQAWGDLIPVGTPAWRTNLLSAVLGAAAVTVLFRLLRILDVRRTVAAATALTFAVSPTFWTQASVAEVYTLHILFLASVTLCLAKWRLGASNAWLLGGLFIYALSFGHHLMTVLALPGIAWLVWSDRQRAVTLRNALWVAGFGLIGAAQYLYLLYMAQVGLYVEVPVRNLADLWDLIRGGEFKDEMWGFSLFQWLEVRVPLLGEVVGAEYLLLQAPIAYGMWRGVRADQPRRDISVHLLSLGALSTIFATNYDVFDVQVFFLPLLFVLAVFLGLGLEGIIGWAHANYPGHERVIWGATAALIAVPLITGVVDYRRSSQRGNFEDAQRIERAIDVADRDALFLTDNYAETQYLAYYLVVDRLGEERNLAVVGRIGVSVKDIKRYLHDGGGNVATAAAQVADVPQPRLFVAYPALATKLARSGVEVIEVEPDVWQVPYPTNWQPASARA